MDEINDYFDVINIKIDRITKTLERIETQVTLFTFNLIRGRVLKESNL